MKKSLLCAAATLFASAAACAAPIQFIQTGFGAGTLDGVAFGNLAPVAFTIRATSDTANVQSCGANCVTLVNQSATIEIGTLGTFGILSATRFFSVPTAIGFSRSGVSQSDLYNLSSANNAWDMTTSIGPINLTGRLLQWDRDPQIDTTGGILLFPDLSNIQGTFQAIVDPTSVVPVPGSLLLLGSGLAGLLAIRRGRKPAMA